MSSRLRRLKPALLLAAVTLVAAACGDGDGYPLDTLNPQGPKAEGIHNLVKPVFLVATIVFILVEGGIIFLLMKFRDKSGNEDGSYSDEEFPPQVHGNNPLEIGWTIAPAIVLALVAVPTVFGVFALEEKSDDALVIDVYGHQWWWSYEYDSDGDGEIDIITANDLVIPAERDVELRLRSRDVIHSFWIPSLNGKKDAVPYADHEKSALLVLNANAPGIYEGQCTEFCGLSHGVMRMRVEAMTAGDFDAWTETQRAPATPPATTEAEDGRAVFASRCTSCHVVNDTELVEGIDGGPPAYGEDFAAPGADFRTEALLSGVAPNLTHFASRTSFIGGVHELYPNGEFDRNLLEEWLRDPPSFKAMRVENGQGMPNLGLSEDEIDSLVAYLEGLS